MNKKELKQEYKSGNRSMGVYQIRNLKNGKVFIGSTLNMDGSFNRHKFELDAGGHQNKLLQTDWNESGAENFAFEILEDVSPTENPGYDYTSDLKVLEELWLEKLNPYDDNGYNGRKRTREERLQMIAAKRK